MHRHPLRLAQEFTVLEAAYEAGVKVPRPYR
jgi:serine/threonine-protein kinase RIO1